MTVPVQRIASLKWCIVLDNVVMGPREATYTDQMIGDLRSMGMTGVRIPVECGAMVAGIPRWNTTISDTTYVAHCQQRLATVIQLCLNHGLGVVLCPFTNATMFARGLDQTLKDVLSVQDYLATTYGSQAPVLFELLNEPRDVPPDTWNVWHPQIAGVIRRRAPRSTLVIPPAGFSVPTNFPKLTLSKYSNAVYTFHMYEPSGITGQTCEPGTVYPKLATDTDPRHNGYTTAKVRAYMQYGQDFAKANGVFVWMGEYGCARKANLIDPPSRENWTKDIQQAAKDMGFGLCYWAYDSEKWGLNSHGLGYDPLLKTLLTR